MPADRPPLPKLDEHGVPHCTGERCPLFDGKRCRGTGFPPEGVCEPAVREMAAELVQLRTARAAFSEVSRG